MSISIVESTEIDVVVVEVDGSSGYKMRRGR